MHPSATEAANATKFRVHSREMPNVAVPVWFWHRGTYGGVTGEFGHVVIWVPGRGFLSSPVVGVGSLWLSSISEVERTFGATYRFYSLDINTLTVAEAVTEELPPPVEDEGEEMAQAHSMQAAINGVVTQAVYDRDGFWTQWIGGDDKYNANIRKMFGCSTLHCRVSESHFNAIKRSVLSKSSTKVEILSPSIPVGAESA